MLIDHPEINEVDINPLISSPDEIIAVDARIIIDEKSSKKTNKTKDKKTVNEIKPKSQPVEQKPTAQPVKTTPIPSRPIPQMPKKLDKKVLGILISLIIMIVVIVLIVVILFQTGVIGGPEEKNFYGTWESDLFSLIYNEDNTLELYVYNPGNSVEIGAWSVDGKYLKINVLYSEQYNYLSGSYACDFQNDNQELTLRSNNQDFMTFFKIDEF